MLLLKIVHTCEQNMLKPAFNRNILEIDINKILKAKMAH